MIQDPRNLDFKTWSDIVTTDNNLAPLGVAESDWRTWALNVLQTVASVPNPLSFASWQAWAMAWIRST